jgi:sugar/nucleoside kinase (ribokinase family)
MIDTALSMARNNAESDQMIDLVTIGWLTMDDIVLPDATCHPQVIGGGALYSAIGARVWQDRVGLHSVTGENYLQSVRNQISKNGLDVTGLNSIAGNGLELWVLHETETEKQQIPKLTSSTAEAMDSGRGPLPEAYRGSRGFHVAPQTPASSIANVSYLSSLASKPIITLDILADTYIDANEFLDLSFLKYLTAFIPSREEVHRIWHPVDLSEWMQEQVATYHRCIAVKLGGMGSLVCEGPQTPVLHVPALSVQVVDTTGAGDSYCGGFLAGLVAGRPLVECAVMGTVSASFVVQACGALATPKPTAGEKADRFASVLRRVSEWRT